MTRWSFRWLIAAAASLMAAPALADEPPEPSCGECTIGDTWTRDAGIVGAMLALGAVSLMIARRRERQH